MNLQASFSFLGQDCYGYVSYPLSQLFKLSTKYSLKTHKVLPRKYVHDQCFASIALNHPIENCWHSDWKAIIVY